MLLGIILLPLLRGFSLIRRMWVFPLTHVISLCGERTELSFFAGVRDLGVSLDLSLLWAWRVGLHAYFSNHIYIYIYIYIYPCVNNVAYSSHLHDNVASYVFISYFGLMRFYFFYFFFLENKIIIFLKIILKILMLY